MRNEWKIVPPVLWFKPLPGLLAKSNGQCYDVVFAEMPGYRPLYAKPICPELDRIALRDAIANAIGGDAYDCSRVWHAWGVGTMSEEDFVPLVDQEDRLDEIVEACLGHVTRLTAERDGLLAEVERLRKVTNFEEAVACVFDNLKFAAANTGSKEWDDQLEDLAEEVIECAPKYKKQWKDICSLQSELTKARELLTKGSHYGPHPWNQQVMDFLAHQSAPAAKGGEL